MRNQVLAAHQFSVAPMLDWTDKHCRYFHRLLSRHAVLYTEMVTTGAIIHGSGDYLAFNEQEHPLVLQLGGSEPAEMAHCAKLAEQRGYDAVNINVGCPSDRVQNGMFGACLMAQPARVADCVKAMQDAVSIPVTVKTRIGIDDSDDYQFLQDFVSMVAAAGCEQFIIHARKAWLKGLSPKENREIPPLNYPRVQQLKQEFPQLNISLNGGIKTLQQAKEQLQYLDGVMVGREAYTNPLLLSEVDSLIYADTTLPLTPEQVVLQMLPYIEQQMQQGARFWHIARHMLGLFQGRPGARQWRRLLSEQGHFAEAKPELLLQALAKLKPVADLTS
ncbi:tRNA dihydrouridine(20/20a) synthase DusA [Rheinheimera nanhaiensis]|uniref:tRNA-dihydrouridine(20/20a) synthase n=1 Tax=Rheinheimera nanhaiensis E407-8 TaxID=562729 RepID=I1DT34_9GAMM|nr:tRNA dihydrouridine(20/20a) synthase DusA [Rheinheimera nanhaiensis]GAB57212.1 tRNA-dihydrouridine synthase A [Rheinheimera nanhaiensis E407-8]